MDRGDRQIPLNTGDHGGRFAPGHEEHGEALKVFVNSVRVAEGELRGYPSSGGKRPRRSTNPTERRKPRRARSAVRGWTVVLAAADPGDDEFLAGHAADALARQHLGAQLVIAGRQVLEFHSVKALVPFS